VWKNGHMLWHTAFLLMSILTVLLGYYGDMIAAVVFWAISVLILVYLRPE
jgi:uncharacterized membrane protein